MLYDSAIKVVRTLAITTALCATAKVSADDSAYTLTLPQVPTKIIGTPLSESIPVSLYSSIGADDAPLTLFIRHLNGPLNVATHVELRVLQPLIHRYVQTGALRIVAIPRNAPSTFSVALACAREQGEGLDWQLRSAFFKHNTEDNKTASYLDVTMLDNALQDLPLQALAIRSCYVSHIAKLTAAGVDLERTENNPIWLGMSGSNKPFPPEFLLAAGAGPTYRATALRLSWGNGAETLSRISEEIDRRLVAAVN